MTKCQHCDAEVFSQPNRMGTTPEMQKMYDEFGGEDLRKRIAEINVDQDKHPEGNLQYVLIRGFSAMGWSQPTLASNDAIDAIATLAATPALCPDCGRSVDGPTHAAYCAATPAVGGEREALKSLANEVSGVLGMPGLREAIGNTNVAVLRDRLENARAALAQPASPLRGRDATIKQCATVAYDYPVPEGQDDSYQSGFIDACGFVGDAIFALSASPPEQPAADAVTK